MSTIDDFLEEGLEIAVAHANGVPIPAPTVVHPPTTELFAPTKRPEPPISVLGPPTQPAPTPIPRSLPPNRVRNRGGVIRNPSPKITVQTSNPITNPKRSSSSQSRGKVIEPLSTEEEAMQEFRAQNPGVSVPTLMTGMDVNAAKPKSATQVQQSQPEKPSTQQPGQPKPLGYETTLRQIIQMALDNGGAYNVGNSRFVLTVKIHPQPVNLTPASTP